MTVAYSSKPESPAGGHLKLGEVPLRLTGAALVVLMMIATPRSGWATGPPPSAQQSAEPPQLGTITPYLGVPITEIEVPGVPAEEAAHLLAATPLKLGEPLTRQALHDAMQAMFATGRFAARGFEAAYYDSSVNPASR